AVVLYVFDGYKGPELRRPEQELERSCKAVGVSFLGLVLFNFVVFRAQVFSRYLLISWFVMACILVVAMRFALRAAHEKLWKAGLFRRRAVLVGSISGLSEYQRLLSTQRHYGYEVAGVITSFVNSESRDELLPNAPILGSLDKWEESLANSGADVVIV